MIFNLTRGHFGDAIAMLPAMVAYQREFGRDAFVFADEQISDLIPDYDWKLKPESLAVDADYRVVTLDVWKAVEKFGKTMHPTQMFFAQLGLPVPDGPQRPEIVIDESAPAYDYVIAPFANDPARAMPFDFLSSIIWEIENHDRKKIRGNCWVIGSAQDLGRSLNTQERHLPYVAGLMRNARKAVITVDSMANRLAHAAGVENHVLLCSDVVPLEWATHPKARVLYGAPDTWTVEKVLELLP